MDALVRDSPALDGGAAGPAPKISGRIPSLNALRAFAVGLVLFAHLPSARKDSFLPSWLTDFDLGQLGVDVFFVLSGYLITRLLLEEEASFGRVDLAKFYIRRALRILPPLYLYLLVLACLQPLGLFPSPWPAFLGAALFVYNVLPYTQWGLAHCWTLATEEQFYLLWAPLFKWLTGARISRLQAALALVVFGPVFRVAFYLAWPLQSWRLDRILPGRLDTIMAGCLLALAERDALGQQLLRILLKLKLPLLSFPILALSVFLKNKLHGTYYLTAGYSVDAFALAMMIAGASRTSAGVWGKLFNARPVNHLGNISYDLYLWHVLFLTPLNLTWSGALPWNLGCSFLAAEISYAVTGRPLQRLRRRFAR